MPEKIVKKCHKCQSKLKIGFGCITSAEQISPNFCAPRKHVPTQSFFFQKNAIQFHQYFITHSIKIVSLSPNLCANQAKHKFTVQFHQHHYVPNLWAEIRQICALFAKRQAPQKAWNFRCKKVGRKY